MNPVLFNGKIIDFTSSFTKEFAYIMMLLGDYKDECGDKFFSLNEHFQQNPFLPLVDFAKSFKDFITENQLTHDEKEFFIKECIRTFKEKITIIDTAYEEFKGNEDKERYYFQYGMCKRSAEILIEFLNYELKLTRKNSNTQTNLVDESVNLEPRLEWNNKTEISELIYVLFHSQRIRVNGRPIEQKELTKVFSKLFNTEIEKPVDLLNKSVKTFKKGEDGNTFLNELNSILHNYIDKIKEKEK